MPPAKHSVEEIRAVAEAAITAEHARVAAKTALDAKPEDQTLKDAYAAAEVAATSAKAKADALSQRQTLTPEQIAKHKRKIAIMQTELKNAGVGDDTDDDDDDDDDDKPLTRGDLKRMQVSDASHTALEMAGAITDQEAKAAITAALADIKPSGDADADFKKAVAIASIDKNNKILEELRRKPMTTNHRSGSGAPPRPAGAAFEPTALEISYMKPPFNLTKEQIIASRPQ